ncbi:MAG: molybdenum cofactor biosynthesis protein B [Acidobacteriota bacterium]
MGHREHQERAPAKLGCAVLSVSDTRDATSDESGRLLRERLGAEGHRLVAYRIVPDEAWAIAWTLQEWCLRDDVDAILITGGTGVARRDRTPEAVESLLDIRLEGFGERFRSRSEAQIGSAAILSRALAGARNGKAIFVLPGSRRAVELGLEALILPELGHVVGELRK